ncbi:glutaminase [Porphyromonadaceae bacterium OttesenSCG-928-L07]|nr:glutaminase [Porphyromonadaceae bacterium OttesenSCG-928-L07]MDL2252034.1 glutaminase [Odoribacter sp. OttesenSCG-928-J03]MDL2331149.1 glutaminase [Odoribacter sp. OttesenSCG-928-A06]
MEEQEDFQRVIEKIYKDVIPFFGKGKVADYIPALADVDPKQYGIAIATVDGKIFGVGDYQTKFSIQSISKVFTLSMVVRHIGHELWRYVGREPSGTPFNSLVQLEQEEGIPRNPFINAGALVVTDKLMELYDRPKEAILDFVRKAAGTDSIFYDENIATSELEHADRNRALGYFMKSFANIRNNVEALVDLYCNHCSIAMNCEELAKSFLFLANHGINPHNQESILSVSRAKRLSALMLTCGFYDESGDFAFRVGMPGKSGVGGGIVAIIPGKLTIAVWSPELNKYGNSFMGIETLERFTTDIGISIF